MPAFNVFLQDIPLFFSNDFSFRNLILQFPVYKKSRKMYLTSSAPYMKVIFLYSSFFLFLYNNDKTISYKAVNVPV